MTKNAYRKIIPLFLITAGLAAARMLSECDSKAETVAQAASVQVDDMLKLAQEIRKLEKDVETTKKKIAGLTEKLADEKSNMLKQHEKAFDRARQIEVGKKVTTWFAEHKDVSSAKEAVDGFDTILRAEFGSDMIRASRSGMEQSFADFMEEGLPPSSETRAGRAIAEAFQLTCDSNFELAWTNRLRQTTAVWKDLEELNAELRLLNSRLDVLRRQQTATISARIPAQMIPVPRAQNILLGWSADKIVELSTALGDDLEKNKFCLLATPQITTTVDEFMIDQFEVTHLAYWYFCKQTGHEFPRVFAGTKPLPGGKEEPIWMDMWPGGKVPEGMEKVPVVYVSRDDALAYCRWTGARLPTEFEWEVAARSGPSGFDGRIWPWGNAYEHKRCNDATALDHPSRERAFMLVPESIRDKMPGAVPVGTFDNGATPLGIHDMVGNVAEWTNSPFEAYPGYTSEVKVSKTEVVDVPDSHFSENYGVYRGGHCDQRDMVVSGIFRNYAKYPSAPWQYVGFRRARSGLAGLDQMIYLMRNGRLDSRIQDFKLCKSDEAEKRILPKLDTREGKFAILEKFDWNEELQVPGEAHHILAINRSTVDIDSFKDLARDSRGDDDFADSFLVGVIDTEVPFTNPPLDAGTWFVSFKASRKYKDETTKKTVTLPDALLFVPEKTGAPSYRMDLNGSEVFVPKQGKDSNYKTALVPTTLINDEKASADRLRITFSFDKGTSKNPKQVLVEFDVETAKGALADFQ